VSLAELSQFLRIALLLISLANATSRKYPAVMPLRIYLVPVMDYDVPGSLFCAVCKTNIPREAWARHLAGRRHYAKERFAVYRAALDEAESDKHGVTVSTNGDFGIVETAATGAARSVALTIENTVPSSRITIVDAKLGSIAATTSLSA
jgi:hypothetical protein